MNNSRKPVYTKKKWHLKIFKMAFNSKGTKQEYTMQQLVDAIFSHVFDEKHPERLQDILTSIFQ